MSNPQPNRPHRAPPHPAAPLTPYGNRPMVTPIVHAVNYEYLNFEVLRQITERAQELGFATETLAMTEQAVQADVLYPRSYGKKA